jgi:SAM-dependent methyltransferase
MPPSYDTPGSGMFAPEVLERAVDRLAELPGDGRALEFAIGTGRVAVPLAERGVPVTGIELSPAMIASAGVSMSLRPPTLITRPRRRLRRGLGRRAIGALRDLYRLTPQNA